MTPRQQQCLDTIQRLTVGGVGPSYEELRLHLGLASKSGVHRLVQSLKERGYLNAPANRARAVVVVSHEAEGVPFDRMAEAALQHAYVRFNLGKPVTVATMRQALVAAFRSGGQ